MREGELAEECRLCEEEKKTHEAELLQFRQEDKEACVVELREERRLCEEEKEAREAELRVERRNVKREDETRKQMELLQKLVKGIQNQGDAAVRKAQEGKNVKSHEINQGG